MVRIARGLGARGAYRAARIHPADRDILNGHMSHPADVTATSITYVNLNGHMLHATQYDRYCAEGDRNPTVRCRCYR